MKNLHNEATILLIENNSDWLMNVYTVLQEAGHDVLIATGGNEGFCLARRVRPDLIICEAALPDISGVQLCRMVRADKDLRDTMFLLIGETREGNPEESLDGFDAGADDFLEKNCNPQFLAAKAARLIELRRSEKEIQLSYEMLHRSERHLAMLIEDASKLIASLELPISARISDKPFAAKAKTFFDVTAEPKKQKTEKPLYQSERNADALAVWKQSLQIKDFSHTNELGKELSGRVYYEIAS